MTQHLGWIVVGVAFLGLAHVVQLEGETPKVTWQSGNALQAMSHTETTVGVRGTVDRVIEKYTGTHTVQLVCDDGAPATVVIMPTVGAAIPRTGDRIQVSGKLLDGGVITVTSKDQLSFAVPDFAQTQRRAQWMGYLVNRHHHRSGAVTGTVVDPDHHFLGFASVQKQVRLPTGNPLMSLTGYVSTDGLTLVVEDAAL